VPPLNRFTREATEIPAKPPPVTPSRKNDGLDGLEVNHRSAAVRTLAGETLTPKTQVVASRERSPSEQVLPSAALPAFDRTEVGKSFASSCRLPKQNGGSERKGGTVAPISQVLRFGRLGEVTHESRDQEASPGCEASEALLMAIASSCGGTSASPCARILPWRLGPFRPRSTLSGLTGILDSCGPLSSVEVITESRFPYLKHRRHARRQLHRSRRVCQAKETLRCWERSRPRLRIRWRFDPTRGPGDRNRGWRLFVPLLSTAKKRERDLRNRQRLTGELCAVTDRALPERSGTEQPRVLRGAHHPDYPGLPHRSSRAAVVGKHGELGDPFLIGALGERDLRDERRLPRQ
jgi:hypothetical protein